MGCITVNRPHGRVLHSVDSEETLRAALREDSADSAPQCLQLFPEPRDGAPALLVGVNGERGVLWWSDPARREWPLAVNGDNPDVVWYRYDSEELDFPPRTELPIGTVIDAACEFMRTGHRPTCVSWLDEDDAWGHFLADAP